MRWNISLSVLAFSSSIESRTKRKTAAKSAACVYGVFQSRRRRRRLSHKIPLKAHSLYSAIASHAAPKAFFSPPPSPTPPLSPLFQCIHADLYGLYPPLPSFLPLSFTPSISYQVPVLESDPCSPGISRVNRTARSTWPLILGCLESPAQRDLLTFCPSLPVRPLCCCAAPAFAGASLLYFPPQKMENQTHFKSSTRRTRTRRRSQKVSRLSPSKTLSRRAEGE